MTPQTDSRGQAYFDVGNIRVTAIGKTWGGSSGLRFQAYSGKGNALLRGAELPVPDPATAYQLMTSIVAALQTLE